MKTLSAIFLAILMCLAVPALAGETYVKGYYRKDGTYVAPHYRSTPNKSRLDNYSTKGNVNPHTGEQGQEDAFKRDGKPRYVRTKKK